MPTFQLRNDPNRSHVVTQRGAQVLVDGQAHAVRRIDAQHWVCEAGGQSHRVLGVAHGDTVYLQLDGRVCVLDLVDPTRGHQGQGAGSDAGSVAPMPGVVISHVVQPGAQVKASDALLVIESMKLQMTIHASCDGVLEDLPYAPGQSFDRGVVLARVRAEEALA